MDSFHGIDYATEYRYLGVVIGDDLSFKENLEAIKTQEKNLHKLKWIIEKNNSELDGAAKFHIFRLCLDLRSHMQ